MPRAAERKARCSDLRPGTTTMIGIGIFFSVIGLGYLCWTLFDLIVCALPAIVLCGRPHKTTYVACCDMWRTRRSTLPLLRNQGLYATYR
jgi:hypothetical protein